MELKNKINQNKYKPYIQTLVFLLRLLLLSVPVYMIIYFVNLYPLQVMVATHTTFLLKLMGFHVAMEGAAVSVGTEKPFNFIISEDSTGWKSFLFLSALIIAVPGIKWKKRVIGIFYGIIALYIGNILRVLTIVISERIYGMNIAMLIHDWLWEFGLTAMVLVLWVVWLKYANIIQKTKNNI